MMLASGQVRLLSDILTDIAQGTPVIIKQKLKPKSRAQSRFGYNNMLVVNLSSPWRHLFLRSITNINQKIQKSH